MKKKSRPHAPAKKNRSSRDSFPDNDPEWEHLEERYSQINDEMRKLAELLPLE